MSFMCFLWFRYFNIKKIKKQYFKAFSINETNYHRQFRLYDNL